MQTIRNGREVHAVNGVTLWAIYWRPTVILLFVSRTWLQAVGAPGAARERHEQLQTKLRQLRSQHEERRVEWAPVWPYRLAHVIGRERWPSDFGYDDLESAREYLKQRRKRKRQA